LDRLPDSTQGATRADRGSKVACGDDFRSLSRHFCRKGCERELEAREGGGQVLRAKAFQRLPVQQLGPEGPACQRRNLAPIHAGGKHGPNQTARAGSRYDSRPDTGLG